MPVYPVSLTVPASLRGRLPPLVLRESREEIEKYVNGRSAASHVKLLTYREIAGALGIREDVIKAFLGPIGGGHTGIIIQNPAFHPN